MLSEAIYRRNANGRYTKLGYQEPFVPEGVHLVYVKTSDGCRTTISKYRIDLDDAKRTAVIAASKDKLTKLVMEACELYPCEKLTEAEREQWEAFKKTKAGKKLCKGMYRKSASDIATHILEEVVECTT